MPGEERSGEGEADSRCGDELGPGLLHGPYADIDYPNKRDVDQSVNGSHFGPSNWRLAVTPGTVGVHHQLPQSIIAQPSSKTTTKRGTITEFSSKARLRMIRRLASLDYTPWVESFQARLDRGDGDLDLPESMAGACADSGGVNCSPTGISASVGAGDWAAVRHSSPRVPATRGTALAYPDGAAANHSWRANARVDLTFVVLRRAQRRPEALGSGNGGGLVVWHPLPQFNQDRSLLRRIQRWPNSPRQRPSGPTARPMGRSRFRRSFLVGVATQAS